MLNYELLTFVKLGIDNCRKLWYNIGEGRQMSEVLIQKLWEIKGDRSFAEMAEDIKGLSEDGLWRIMQGNRGGRMDTWQKIIKAYPELGPLFLASKTDSCRH